MARGQPCGVFGQRRQFRLAVGQHGPGGTGGLGRDGQPVSLAFGGAGQLGLLPLQPRDHFGGVAVQHALALGIPVDLRQPRTQGLDGGARACLGFGQLRLLHPQPLQHGGGDGLFLAQRGQSGLSHLARGPGGTRGGLGPALHDQALAQGALGLGHGRIRLAKAAVQEHPLGPPQILADLAIARGGARLPGQRGDLQAQPLQHIVHPHKVGFRRRQPQLRLVPARIKARDARRLFQNPPPRLGLGRDQFRNLPLPHQRRGMRPGRGIGEQHLHVARPRLARVHPIG